MAIPKAAATMTIRGLLLIVQGAHDAHYVGRAMKNTTQAMG